MKKKIITLLDRALLVSMIGLLPVSFMSCKDTDPKPEERTSVVVTGSLPTFAAQEGITGKLDLKWKSKDEIGVYYVPSPTGTMFNNLKFKSSLESTDKIDNDFNVVTAGVFKWSNVSTKHTFYATYPYKAAENSDFRSHKFSIPEVQTVQGAASLISDMFLVGKVEVDKLADKVSIPFETPLAIVALELDAAGSVLAEEMTEYVQLKADVNIAGDAEYNFETGKVSGFTKNSVRLNFDDKMLKDKFVVYLAINPNLANVPVELSVGDATYTATTSITIERLEAGKINLIKVKFSEIESNNKLVINDEGVIHNEVVNSYIIKPNSHLILPVSRAFDAWQSEFGFDLGSLGELTTKLLWTDVEGGLSLESNIKSIRMFHKDAMKDAGISIKTGKAQGNALVALLWNGNVVWSWHIWVTDYDPNLADGQRTVAGYTLMDRNIGATSIIYADIKAQGLAYQWGRKDPFPGNKYNPDQFGIMSYQDVYNSLGELVTPGDQSVPEENRVFMSMVAQTENDIDGIQAAVENPTALFNSKSSYYMYWASNNILPNYPGMRRDLWISEQGTKTIYDPCPAGWRTIFKAVEIINEMYESSYQKVAGGAYFDNFGYFPINGYIEGSSYGGGLWKDRNLGHIWTGLGGGPVAVSLKMDDNGANVILKKMEDSNEYRVGGFHVRCQKDE